MSEQIKISPKITFFEWGKLEIVGCETPFRDAKLYPGGAREWDWTETGTRHSPGIQPADVDELIDNGARTIVLSKGVQLKLKTQKETLQYLEDKGVDVFVLQTGKAIQKYNDLAEAGEPVGALIHSTC